MKRLAFVLLVVASNATAGSLYRCNSPDGSRTYTTKPMEGAECSLISVRPMTSEEQAASEPDPNWELFGSNDDSKMYLRRNNLVRKGNQVSVWSLNNYAQPQRVNGATFRSSVSRWIVDCVEKTHTLQQVVQYEKASGGGASVRQQTVPVAARTTDYAVPDSLGETLILRACEATTPKPTRKK